MSLTLYKRVTFFLFLFHNKYVILLQYESELRQLRLPDPVRAIFVIVGEHEIYLGYYSTVQIDGTFLYYIPHLLTQPQAFRHYQELEIAYLQIEAHLYQFPSFSKSNLRDMGF